MAPVPETHTRPKQVRIPDEDWEKFKQNAGTRQRAAVLLAFIRWYNGEPGSKLPLPPRR
jgi:hypothetical protein